MSVITLRLPEKLLHDLDAFAYDIRVSRVEYIRRAIEQMNNHIRDEKRAERLKKISLRVRKESMSVNKEFNRVEEDLKD